MRGYRNVSSFIMHTNAFKTLLCYNIHILCNVKNMHPKHIVLQGDNAMGNRLQRAFEQRNQIFDYTKLKNNFYPFTKDERNEYTRVVKTNYTFDRTALNTMLFGRLISKGHSIDDILNFGDNSSEKLKNDYNAVKEEFLNVLPKDENNLEQQTKYNTFAAESYICVLQKGMDYVNDKIRANGTYSNCSFDDKKKLMFINSIINDAFQEYERTPDESKAVLNAQDPGDNTGKDYMHELSTNAMNTTFSFDTYDKIADHATTLYDNYYSDEPGAKGRIDGTIELLQGVIPYIVAQKMVEKSINDANDKKVYELRNTSNVADWRAFASEDASRLPHNDMMLLNSLMENEVYRNVLVGELLSSKEEKFFEAEKLDDGTVAFDFSLLLNRAKEIVNTPVERFQMEDLLTDIADKYLEQDNRRDDINDLSINEKISYLMNQKVIGRGDGYIYGENDKKYPTQEQKVDAFINELIADKAAGKEVYSYIPGTGGVDGTMHRINSNNTVGINKNPTKIWNPREKDALISQIEKIKSMVDSKGTTLRDSGAFRNFKKSLNTSLKELKSTLDIQKKDAILNNLAQCADKYYFEKLDQPQNSRRSVRFNAASILRNINKKDFTPELNLKQNILEKAAVRMAKIMQETGNANEKAFGSSVLNPDNHENLVHFANDISTRKPFDELFNGKSNQELQNIFHKYPDIPEIKNISKGKNAVQPQEIADMKPIL